MSWVLIFSYSCIYILSTIYSCTHFVQIHSPKSLPDQLIDELASFSVILHRLLLYMMLFCIQTEGLKLRWLKVFVIIALLIFLLLTGSPLSRWLRPFSRGGWRPALHTDKLEVEKHMWVLFNWRRIRVSLPSSCFNSYLLFRRWEGTFLERTRTALKGSMHSLVGCSHTALSSLLVYSIWLNSSLFFSFLVQPEMSFSWLRSLITRSWIFKSLPHFLRFTAERQVCFKWAVIDLFQRRSLGCINQVKSLLTAHRFSDWHIFSPTFRLWSKNMSSPLYQLDITPLLPSLLIFRKAPGVSETDGVQTDTVGGEVNTWAYWEIILSKTE